MPISSTHPDYDAHINQWQRCRDCVDGEDAVKARGTKYLPRLSDQDNDEYGAYLLRAYWFGAAARTVQGLAGTVMRKEPITEAPTVLDDVLADVTQTGISFEAFCKTALEEVLKTGRYGVLVDMPDAQTVDQRPYWVGYEAEQIINWQTEMIGGIPTLIMVVLCEAVVEEDPDDEYILNTIEQYRELYLEEATDVSPAIYRQQLWRKQKNITNGQKEWLPYGSEITPVFRQSPLTYLPFCFLNPSTITPSIAKPPILDLASANISHFRSSADLEHGRHFCGLPTPWVAGFPVVTKLKIGSSVAWVSDDPNAKVGMLEFTGQGLGALERAIDSKSKDMAILGARLLEGQKATVEAANTLITRLSGEQSIMQSVANTLSVGFSKLLEWSALWLGVGETEAKKATAKLNTELIDTKISFTDLTELVKNWQAGAMSYETMYYNMERGGMTRPGIEFDEEQAQIEIEKPAVIPQNIDPLTGLPDPTMNPDGTPMDGMPAKKPNPFGNAGA